MKIVDHLEVTMKPASEEDIHRGLYWIKKREKGNIEEDLEQEVQLEDTSVSDKEPQTEDQQENEGRFDGEENVQIID